MASSTYLHTLRTKLGLTIEDLAKLIDCHRGTWAMAEIGKRTLPTQSRWLVSRLEQAVDIAETDNTILETAESREFCLKYIKKAQLKLNQTTLLLEQATEKFDKITLQRKTLAVWASTLLPTDPENTQQQTQILMRKAAKKSSAITQQILAYQIGIAGLNAEIAAAEKKIVGLKFLFNPTCS